MAAICMIKNCTPNFIRLGATLKSILCMDGENALYRPRNRVMLKIKTTIRGEAQSARHRLTRLPLVVNVNTYIIPNETNCCINVLKDASAGRCSANMTVLMVLRIKLMQKYVMIMHIEANKPSEFSVDIFRIKLQLTKGAAISRSIISGMKIRQRIAYVVLTYFLHKS